MNINWSKLWLHYPQVASSRINHRIIIVRRGCLPVTKLWKAQCWCKKQSYLPYKTVQTLVPFFFLFLNSTCNISNQLYRKKSADVSLVFTCFSFALDLAYVDFNIISHPGDFALNSRKVSVVLTIPSKGAYETRFPRYFRLAIHFDSSGCFAAEWQVVGFSQLTFRHKSCSFKTPSHCYVTANK